MLSCSRSQLERNLQTSIADCISTQPTSEYQTEHGGLSDGIGLSDVPGRDIERIVRINKRMKDLGLNFYAVCGRAGKPSYRIIRPSCVEESNIGYMSPGDVSERLKKLYGLSLETVLDTPLPRVRKQINDAIKEKGDKEKQKVKKEPRSRKEPKPRPEPKPEPRPEPKPEPRPEPETKPEPKPRSKPRPKPKPDNTDDCEHCDDEPKPKMETKGTTTEEKLDAVLKLLESRRKAA